jgi:hypothetical protein
LQSHWRLCLQSHWRLCLRTFGERCFVSRRPTHQPLQDIMSCDWNLRWLYIYINERRRRRNRRRWRTRNFLKQGTAYGDNLLADMKLITFTESTVGYELQITIYVAGHLTPCSCLASVRVLSSLHFLYCIILFLMAVPWLRWLVAGHSPRRSGFAPGSIHVGFMVDKIALRQVFLRVLRFPCQCHSTVALQTHIIWGMNNMFDSGSSSET